MSVLSINLAIACSVHFAGATADIAICFSMKSEYELTMKKMEGEDGILDVCTLCDGYLRVILTQKTITLFTCQNHFSRNGYVVPKTFDEVQKQTNKDNTHSDRSPLVSKRGLIRKQ